MVLRALSSLKADLGPVLDVGATKVGASGGGAGLNVDQESATKADAFDVEPELEATLRNTSDSPKIKPEARSDPPKKAKSKTSSAKASLAGFSDRGEQDDIETITVFKKG
jgi:hypothetical protein